MELLRRRDSRGGDFRRRRSRAARRSRRPLWSRREKPSTTLPGFDRVLGGGLVAGSVVLLGGEPGIGKVDAAAAGGPRRRARSGDVLYATGEESAAQVRLRGERLGIREERLLVLAETDVARVVALAEKQRPALLIVDSIQAVRDSALTSARERSRRCATRRSGCSASRSGHGVPVILIGHVTKDGSLAGPKSLEHLVDAVVSIEGERSSLRRDSAGDQEPIRPRRRARALRDDRRGAGGDPDASAALLSERRAACRAAR